MNSKTVLNVDIVCSAWKQLSVDPKWTELERTWLAVWDYPVSDTYTRVSNNNLRFMVKQNHAAVWTNDRMENAQKLGGGC